MTLSTTQELISDKAKEGHFLLTLIQSGTGESHLATEIVCELLKDGKSVSNESYFVIILVCAKIKGRGGEWAGQPLDPRLFIAIVNIYAYRTERHWLHTF